MGEGSRNHKWAMTKHGHNNMPRKNNPRSVTRG
jgi:hypothetical protein